MRGSPRKEKKKKIKSLYILLFIQLNISILQCCKENACANALCVLQQMVYNAYCICMYMRGLYARSREVNRARSSLSLLLFAGVWYDLQPERRALSSLAYMQHTGQLISPLSRGRGRMHKAFFFYFSLCYGCCIELCVCAL